MRLILVFIHLYLVSQSSRLCSLKCKSSIDKTASHRLPCSRISCEFFVCRWPGGSTVQPSSTVSPNASCASRCSTTTTDQQPENSNTTSWICGCSDDCLLKNSCCFDYAAFCLTGTGPHHFLLLGQQQQQQRPPLLLIMFLFCVLNGGQGELREGCRRCPPRAWSTAVKRPARADQGHL